MPKELMKNKYVIAFSLVSVFGIVVIFFFLLYPSAKYNTGFKSFSGNKGGDIKITLYTSSSGEDKLARKPDLNFENGYVDTAMAVLINEKQTLQKIEGFGATFNEAGMICLNSLKPASRDSVLMALFDPVNGAGYTLMKSPIAACDFASAGPWYSYNDTKGDTLMENFSIERDLKPDGLIPFIKSAAKYGRFKIESPMDFAPDWMLYGLKDGQKHVRKEYYAALARYYSKFISEYARNGVTIDYLNPFNEPQNSWYSNETYKAIGIMVKDFIVPQFLIDGIRTRIQLCETANRPEAIQKLPDALDDPDVRKHINSITVHGYDWDKFSTITQLHNKYPDIPIWQTEVCYATKSNVPENGPSKVPVYDFSDGEFWGNMIMNDMKNWASAWIYWNMILDEKGGPWLISDIHGDPDNNFQHPVVIINRQTGEVSYTGLYYYLAHFSRFIRPNAFRIESKGGPDQINHAAFINSDGSIIVVLINNGEAVECPVRWMDVTVKLRIAPHSVATLTWKS
jgi:glucosylceramidase